jgi:hypothetical protein
MVNDLIKSIIGQYHKPQKGYEVHVSRWGLSQLSDAFKAQWNPKEATDRHGKKFSDNFLIVELTLAGKNNGLPMEAYKSLTAQGWYKVLKQIGDRSDLNGVVVNRSLYAHLKELQHDTAAIYADSYSLRAASPSSTKKDLDTDLHILQDTGGTDDRLYAYPASKAVKWEHESIRYSKFRRSVPIPYDVTAYTNKGHALPEIHALQGTEGAVVKCKDGGYYFRVQRGWVHYEQLSVEDMERIEAAVGMIAKGGHYVTLSPKELANTVAYKGQIAHVHHIAETRVQEYIFNGVTWDKGTFITDTTGKAKNVTFDINPLELLIISRRG